MKDIIDYWFNITIKYKLYLIYYIFAIPAFIIHELSHLFFIYLFNIPFSIKDFIIFKYDKKNFVYYDMIIESDIENISKWKLKIVAISPNIIYIICLILSLILMYFYIYFGLFIFLYSLLYRTTFICSDVDLKTFKELN